MTEKQICPNCNGEKIIFGNCECNMEWRGSDGEGGWEDCQCDPDHECSTCNGKGFIE